MVPRALRLGAKRLLPLLLLLAAAALAPAGNAAASCAGPQLRVGAVGDSPPGVEIGSAVTVRGSFFVHGCDDTGGRTMGCAGEQRTTETPMGDVTLTIRQGGQRWDLGTKDAGTAAENKLGRLAWHVEIPADLRPGPAVLRADGATLKVTVDRPAAGSAR